MALKSLMSSNKNKQEMPEIVSQYSKSRRSQQNMYVLRLLAHMAAFIVVFLVYAERVYAASLLPKPLGNTIFYSFVFLVLTLMIAKSLLWETRTVVGFLAVPYHEVDSNYVTETWKVYEIPKILTEHYLFTDNASEIDYRLQFYKLTLFGIQPTHEISITKEEYVQLQKAKRKNTSLVITKKELDRFVRPCLSQWNKE